MSSHSNVYRSFIVWCFNCIPYWNLSKIIQFFAKFDFLPKKSKHSVINWRSTHNIAIDIQSLNFRQQQNVLYWKIIPNGWFFQFFQHSWNLGMKWKCSNENMVKNGLKSTRNSLLNSNVAQKKISKNVSSDFCSEKV